MAGSVNKVILVGNLGQDPEIRQTQDGRPIANLSVATTDSWRDKNSGEKREKTEWHRVVIFSEGLCRVAENYLKKGAKVYIEGALQTRKWQDKSGQDRYSTEVVLQGFNGTLTMLDGRSGGGAGMQDGGQSSYGGGGNNYASNGGGGGGGFGGFNNQRERLQQTRQSIQNQLASVLSPEQLTRIEQSLGGRGGGRGPGGPGRDRGDNMERGQVWVLENGAPRRIQLLTGLSDDQFTEIVTDELKGGDEVIVRLAR